MRVRVWDVETGEQVQDFEGTFVAGYSADGHRLIAAGGTAIRIWEAETGRLLASLEGHSDQVRSASFSPDGTRIVTVSLNGTAKVWHAQLTTRTPEEISRLAQCFALQRFDEQGRLLPNKPTPSACKDLL